MAGKLVPGESIVYCHGGKELHGVVIDVEGAGRGKVLIRLQDGAEYLVRRGEVYVEPSPEEIEEMMRKFREQRLTEKRAGRIED